jgi:HK97 family phage portal protein
MASPRPTLAFTPISFSADDSQFLQQRELSTREIARMFRVPAWAIDGATGDSLTYANVAEQARALVTYSLRPWLVRIERALSNDADLCPGNTYVQRDGWMSRAEVRELEDLQPEPVT